MPGRPHAAALASVDATQVGTGKPSDPMISLPLLSRCRPQNTLRLAGHRNGPGTETHESSGRTQTKGRPVHAIRPERSELKGARGLYLDETRANEHYWFMWTKSSPSGQPFHVEVMLELTPLAPNMQACTQCQCSGGNAAIGRLFAATNKPGRSSSLTLEHTADHRGTASGWKGIQPVSRQSLDKRRWRGNRESRHR